MTDVTELTEILGVFCPLHLIISNSGHIISTGATLQKLRPGQDLVGQRFLEVFNLTRPRRVSTVSELQALSGVRLHLQFRQAPHSALKGILVSRGDAGIVINLSLGISVLEAVNDYALTSTDFAATDLTVEMLYLMEAKSAAMEASRSLNARLQGAMIAAEEQAFTDTLTGLKNRRALDHVLSRMRSSQTDYALMHLDLDYFKAVNDSFGHAAGDHVLQHVARIMVQETRDKDTVARVGGDEFVLILQDLNDRERLRSIARRLIDRLEEPIAYGRAQCQISASIGIALSDQRSAAEQDRLIGDADTALYAAKRAGRAQFQFYEQPVERRSAANTAEAPEPREGRSEG